MSIEIAKHQIKDCVQAGRVKRNLLFLFSVKVCRRIPTGRLAWDQFTLRYNVTQH